VVIMRLRKSTPRPAADDGETLEPVAVEPVM
jgi:hypothetical protein